LRSRKGASQERKYYEKCTSWRVCRGPSDTRIVAHAARAINLLANCPTSSGPVYFDGNGLRRRANYDLIYRYEDPIIARRRTGWAGRAHLHIALHTGRGNFHPPSEGPAGSQPSHTPRRTHATHASRLPFGHLQRNSATLRIGAR